MTCGLADDDPLHEPFLRIKRHNDYAFKVARLKRGGEFDALLRSRGSQRGKMSGMPRKANPLWDE